MFQMTAQTSSNISPSKTMVIVVYIDFESDMHILMNIIKVCMQQLQLMSF